MMDRAEQSNGNELRHADAPPPPQRLAGASGGRVHHRRASSAGNLYFFSIIIIHFHFDSRPTTRNSVRAAAGRACKTAASVHHLITLPVPTYRPGQTTLMP